MDHSHSHAHHSPHLPNGHAGRQSAGPSLNHTAFSATLHCLTGCAIGAALGLGNLETIALAITLAFVSGYALTMLPLLRAGLPLGNALKLALLADTVSITIMEIVDNLVMLLIPGALDAPLSSGLFWGSLAFSLAVAGAAAFPVVRWLIARGKGHAVVHAHHAH
jgi:hypothetical protein